MGKMVTVPDVFYNYRLNLESTVAQKTVKHTKDYNWAKGELVKYAEEHDIILDLTKLVHKKEYYKIFNFTVLKVYHYEFMVKYNLFGFIPLGKRVTV